MAEISIASDFSRFPAGRYVSDGPFSGQLFRDTLLVPAILRSCDVTIRLDGTAGYNSSFLEEAFGGLVREHDFTGSHLRLVMSFVSEANPALMTEIWSYIDAAEEEHRKNVGLPPLVSV